MSPAGTEMAGFQQRLASMVNGVVMAPTTSWPSTTPSGGPPAAKAGMAVVGRQQDVDLLEEGRGLQR